MKRTGHDTSLPTQRSGLGARLYPELSLVDDREERHRIFKTAERKLFSSWLAWFVAVPVTPAVILLMVKVKLMVQSAGYLAPWVAMLGLAAAVMAYVFFASTYAVVRPMRRSIRRQLLQRGIPVCRHCGYSLRGLAEPRCPECGRQFEPGLLEKTAVGSSA